MSELERGRSFSEKPLEILAVLLLGIATVGTAWCGYQASQWNDEASELAAEATNSLVEGSRLFGLATQTITYDTNVISQFAQAVATGNEELAEFYRSSLMRDDFAPVLERWKADVDAGEIPGNLLEDDTYLAELTQPYQESQARTVAIGEERDDAATTSDAYVLTTLLLAAALFFAGVMPSFRSRLPRVLLLIGATAAIAVAAARLVDLPVIV